MLKEMWEELLEPENIFFFVQKLFNNKKPWQNQ